MMEIIRVTKENLEQEHICCAISNTRDCQVISKKEWLSQRFDDGLVFLKGNVRGKCFIEYIPAEKAWCPFTAKYVPLLQEIAMSKNVPFQAIRFETAAQAQNEPAPFTSFSLFDDGAFLTHEILSGKKFEKIIAERGYVQSV